MSSTTSVGQDFSPILSEMGESGLGLADGFDRQMDARDIHFSSPSGDDDSYTTGCGSASRPQDIQFTYYRVR